MGGCNEIINKTIHFCQYCFYPIPALLSLKQKIHFHFEQDKVDFSLSLISTSPTVVFNLTLYIPDSHWKCSYI